MTLRVKIAYNLNKGKIMKTFILTLIIFSTLLQATPHSNIVQDEIDKTPNQTYLYCTVVHDFKIDDIKFSTGDNVDFIFFLFDDRNDIDCDRLINHKELFFKYWKH